MAYNPSNVLDDLRRLGLVQDEESYASVLDNQNVPPHQQQQQYSDEWAKSQQRVNRMMGGSGDFEAEELASALEDALGDGGYSQQQQQPSHPPPPPHMMQGAPYGGPPPPGFPGQGGPPPHMGYFPRGQPMPPPYMGQVPPPHMMRGGPVSAPFYGGMPPHMQQQQAPMGGYQPLKYFDGMQMRDTSRMKGWELAKLIKLQAMAVNSGDDFSDDYYNLKTKEKLEKNFRDANSMPQRNIRPADLLAEMQALLRGDSPQLNPGNMMAGGLKTLPIGEMPGFSNQKATSKEKLVEKTKEWHNSHSVLGRSVRTNLKRPRELIAILPKSPVAATAGTDNNSATEKGASSGGSIGGNTETFKSQEWVLRGILGKISEKILQIEDIHRLLEAKLESLQTAEIQKDKIGFAASEEIVQELQQKQISFCDGLGQLLGYPTVLDANGHYTDENQEVELVEGWDALFFLIWTPKGRKLILRAIPCLLRPHLRSFLKTFCTNCAYFVCRNPDGQEVDPPADEEAELDLFAAQTFNDEYRQVNDLAFVTDCLKRTYDVFSQNPAVLALFVHIPAGQTIIRTLLQHGQDLGQLEDTPKDHVTAWDKESDRFYEIMKTAVANLEKEQNNASS